MERESLAPEGWRERKRRETLQRIAEMGLKLFIANGYEATTLEAIAAASGISARTFFYYFKSKEDILLAVFDRLLQLMYQRVSEGYEVPAEPSGWDTAQHLMRTILKQSPFGPEFHSLQYTFLSQIGHREDFRQRLATLD